MYLSASNHAAIDSGGSGALSKSPLIYEVVNKRWEVAFALSDGQPQQVSFANSIATTKGGTHVEMIATQLANKLYVSLVWASILIIRQFGADQEEE